MPNLDQINELKIELDFNDIIESNCKELSNNIKENAKREFGDGDYAKNWTYKIQKGKDGKSEGIIYNKDTYRLSHLLEFGHIIANKYTRTNKRTSPRPHIKPQYDKQKEKFIKDMSSCRFVIKAK